MYWSKVFISALLTPSHDLDLKVMDLASVKNAEVNSLKVFCCTRTTRESTLAMDAVEQNGYELIPHSAYSPDQAPSDFFLFTNLKKDIRGLHFRSDEEVLTAVEEWVNGKDPDFFSSGPDQAPSDFFLFPNLKKDIRGPFRV